MRKFMVMNLGREADGRDAARILMAWCLADP